MRILHLTTSYPESESGAGGIFVKRLVNAQEKAGVTVSVLTPASGRVAAGLSGSVRRFAYAPKKWQVLAQSHGGIPQAIRRSKWNYCIVPQFLSAMAIVLVRCSGQVDVIHAHWSICGAVAVATRSIHQCPVVTTLHGTDARKGRNGVYGFLHRYALRHSDSVVAVSDAIYRQVKSELVDTGEAHMIPNGVAQEFYAIARKNANSTELKLLSVGSLIKLKGYDTTLDALALISPAVNWSLTIAGDGPEKTHLQNKAMKIGVSERVRFVGSKSPDQIVELMRNCDVFLLTSYTEGRPSVVLEAMAAGLGVIATDIEGTRELVSNGVSGWLFPVGQPERLKQIVELIVSGVHDVQRAGFQGRKWMLDHQLTWDRTAAGYIDQYRRVAC